MAICGHLAPNGEKSILYDELYQKYGETKAHDIWEQVRSQQFLNKYGDWPMIRLWSEKERKALEKSGRLPLDANGEPTTEWVEKELGIEVTPVTEIEESIEKESIIAEIKGKKDKTSSRIPEASILEQIKSLYDTANENPDKTYVLPYEYTTGNKKNDIGYTALQMSKLLLSLPVPANVSISPALLAVADNSAEAIVKQFGDAPPPQFMAVNEPAVTESAVKLLIPRLNSEGVREGFFTPEEQTDIVNVIVSKTQRLYASNPALKDRSIMMVMKMLGEASKKLPTATNEAQKALAPVYNSVYQSRVLFTEMALRQLGSLGLRINSHTKSKILEAVQNEEVLGMTAEDWTAADLTIDNVDTTTLDEGFAELAGQIVKDWSESSFELDPKNTASARIKLFIGTLYTMDAGVYSVSENGEQLDGIDINNLDYNQSLQLAKRLNRKPFWFKDAAQSEKLRKLLEANHPRLTQDTVMGLPKVADYNDMFRKILNLLGNKPQNFEFKDSMAILLEHPNPSIQQVAIEMEKQDQSMKNEFMTVMAKQYQAFTTLLFNRKSENGTTNFILNPINSNRNSQADSLINFWKEQQKLSPITILSKTGERVLDTEFIKERWIPILNHAQDITDWTTTDNREWFIKNMDSIMSLSGIDVPAAMLQYMFQYPEKWSSASSLTELFHINPTTGAAEGDMSRFILKSAGLIDIDSEADPLERTKVSQLNNPLYTENTFMNKLAKLYGKYQEEVYSSNHLNAKGRNVWDWGLNSKLSHEFRAFTGTDISFNQFAQQAEANYISKNNWLIRALTNNPKQIAETNLRYLDGLKPEWLDSGRDRGDMSDREQMILALGLFQNNGNALNKNPKVHYLSLTHSDKTTTPLFENMPKLNTGPFGDIDANIIGHMDSALYNVFKSEYERIIYHRDVDMNNIRYDAGKTLFYLIPDFNYDAMKDLVTNQVITQEEFETLWPGNERRLTTILDSARELPVINKILKNFVNNLVNNTIDKWTENKIIDGQNMVFHKMYMYKIAAQNNIESVVRENRTKEQSKRMFRDRNTKLEITPEEYTRIVAGAAAQDYAINTFLFNTSLSQLFYGDPTEAFKASDVEGAKDMDNVRSTMVEYNKRLAKDIAPKADLYWAPEKRLYNTLTLKDVKVTEKYLGDVKGLERFYNNVKNAINSTDAQEITTVQEQLDIMYAAGQVPTKIYGEVSAIITQAGPGGFYEFKLPEHLEIIMQPQKPLYAGTRQVEGARFTDYIKSSAWALYPPFTKGKSVDALRVMMETNNIQRVNFDSAKKLGRPTTSLELFDAQGNFISKTQEEIDSSIQQLHRDGFGIQQEVPHDEGKESIKTLTQMNEGITADIGHLTGFTVPGQVEPLTGPELKTMKENVRKEMLEHNLQEFKGKMNIDERGNIDPELVFNMLEEEIKSDTRDSYSINELQAIVIKDNDGTPMIPLMFNISPDKFEGTIASLINKISEVKIWGKSYVQASSTGIKFNTGNLEDAIRIGNWDGSPLKTMRRDPDNPGKILPAQIVVPFNFFDSKGNKLKVEDFLKPGTNELDMERIPIELLQLVGGRIPNQGHSSMLPMEIVGFVPASLGDLVFVPAAIVKQMGADFDVDKLYTYKRPYTYDGNKFIPVTDKNYGERFGTNNDEWLSLKESTASKLDAAGVKADKDGQYNRKDFNKALGEVLNEKYPDGNVPKHKYELPSQGRTIENMQNDYFNVHWSVLTHPDMLEKVLRPLDQADLKEESDKLAPLQGAYYNFYDPQTQLALFQSGKDAKRLVGLTSWAVKFDQRIQDKGLRISKLEYNQDTKKLEVIEDRITVRDEHTGELKDLVMLSGTGKSYYTADKSQYKELTPEEKKVAERTKGNNHTNVQSESVDNANNRVLDNLNLTPDTYRAVQALIQLQTEDGWAMNSKYWTRLTTQPIIWEFAQEMKQGNDSLTEKYDPQLYQNVINKLRTKYTMMLEGEQDSNLAEGIVFDPNLLLKSTELEGNDYPLHQIAALNLFDRLYLIGKRMFELEAQFTQDVSGAGPNLLTYMDKARNMEDLDRAPIKNANQLYINNGEKTEVGVTYDLLNGTGLSIMSQILPYKNLGTMIGLLKSYTGKANLSIDNQKKFIKALRSTAFTTGEYWWKETQAERVRLIYGENSLAKRVANAYNAWGKTNPLLTGLKTQIALNNEDPDYVTFVGSNNLTDTQINGMSTGWLALLQSTNTEQKQLGEDLIRYSYLSSGIQDANSFVKFIPTSFIAATEFSAMLKDIENQLKSSDTYENYGLLIQYLQHNPELAMRADKEHFGKLDENIEYPESFEIPYGKQDYKAFEKLHDTEGKLVPVVSYKSKGSKDWILYIKNDIGSRSYYTRIDTLGNKFMDEYNGQASAGQRSIFSENRALAEFIPSLEVQPLQSIYSERKDAINGATYYEKIGVKEGGLDELNNALGTIADDKDIPQYLRTVAKFLLNTKKSPETQDAINATGGLRMPLKLRYFDKLNAGGESHFDNAIYLNPKMAGSPEEAAITLLHEVMHNRLQAIVVMTGFDNRVLGTANTPLNTYMNQMITKYKADNSIVVKHMEELDRIRYEAFNALRTQMGEAEFIQVGIDVDNGNVQTDNQRLYYALSTTQELIGHVTTDTLTMNFLNGIQDSKGDSIMSRIWDKLLDIINAISSALGVQVKDGSLLKSALSRTLRLTDLEGSSDIDITHHLLSNDPVPVNTEQQAEDLKELFKTVYNKGVDINDNEVGFILKLSNQVRKTAPVTGQRGKILEQLKKQLSDVQDSRRASHDIAQHVRLSIKDKEIRAQIDSIYQSTNLDTITAIGKRQLEWVDEVLGSKNPTDIDVNLAIKVATLWGSLTDIMYSNVVETKNQDFINITGAATEKRNNLIRGKAVKVISDAVADRVTLTPADYGKNLIDINTISANVYALQRVKPLLVQSVAAHIWQTANNKDEHIQRNTDTLYKLKTQMDKMGMTGNDILDYDEENDSWNLVKQFSQKWYSHHSKLRGDLEASLEAINKLVLEPGPRSEKRQQLWSNYWNEIRKSSVMVDTRAFFDIDKGESITGTKRDAAFQELVDKVGSVEYANQLIKEAGEKYQKYLIEREVIKDHFDSTTTLDPDVEATMTPEEADIALQNKIDTTINDWIRFNSPLELLAKLEGGREIKYESQGDAFIVSVPAQSSTEFFDEKYKKLAENPTKKKVYDEYFKIYSEMISYLPVEVQSQLPDNFFPVVPKDTTTFLARVFDKIRNWDKHALAALTANDVEEALRLRPNKIPIMYLRPAGITKEIDNRSTDPIRVLEVFSMMALQHKYMGDALATIDIAESILKDINRRRLEGQEEGKPIKNLIDGLNYMRDSLVFKKPMELQSKVNTKIYSVNLAKQRKITNEIEALIKERDALDQKWKNQMIEGDYSETDTISNQIDEINKKLTEYEKTARNIYGSKIADSLISINQMKALYWNPFSAVSNFSFAAISLAIYARGRTDYSPKHLREANAVMTHSMKKYFMFSDNGDPVAQKVYSLMQRGGFMGDIVDTDYGKSNKNGAKKSTLQTAADPMNWQRSGDYFNKGALMVAMMKAKMIKLNDLNGNEVEVSLWDAMDKDGKIDESKYQRSETWYSDDISKQKEWMNYRDKIRIVSTMIYGNQDKNSPLMAKKHWLGRMIGQFRMSWFPEGFASRFKPDYYDTILGRQNKGRWVTYPDVGIAMSGLILCKQLINALPGVKINPFEGATVKVSGTDERKPLTDSPIDMENMRKNFAGLAWTVSFTAMILILKSFAKAGQPKDDDDRKRQLLINVLVRNYQDLMLYSSPSVFNTISGNFLPATGVLTDYWNAMIATGHYMFGDTEQEKDAFKRWAKKMAKAGLPHPIATQYGKIETMITRDIDKLQR